MGYKREWVLRALKETEWDRYDNLPLLFFLVSPFSRFYIRQNGSQYFLLRFSGAWLLSGW